jgi:hypothetical protein
MCQFHVRDNSTHFALKQDTQHLTKQALMAGQSNPYPFPIVTAGTRDKQDAVGHLSNDGRAHVFNSGIIEQLVRAFLPF